MEMRVAFGSFWYGPRKPHSVVHLQSDGCNLNPGARGPNHQPCDSPIPSNRHRNRNTVGSEKSSLLLTSPILTNPLSDNLRHALALHIRRRALLAKICAQESEG